MSMQIKQLFTKKWPVSYSQFVWLVSLYLVIAFNGLFLYNVFEAAAKPGHVDWLFIITVPFFLLALTAMVLSWLSLITFVKPILLPY